MTIAVIMVTVIIAILVIAAINIDTPRAAMVFTAVTGHAVVVIIGVIDRIVTVITEDLAAMGAGGVIMGIGITGSPMRPGGGSPPA